MGDSGEDRIPGLCDQEPVWSSLYPLGHQGALLHTSQRFSLSSAVKEDLPSTESPVLGAGPGGDAPSRGSRVRTAEPPGPGAPTLGRLFHELSLSGREELFFIQLPDCMPGPPPAAEGEADPAGPASAAAENKTPGRRGAQPPPPPVSHPGGLLYVP